MHNSLRTQGGSKMTICLGSNINLKKLESLLIFSRFSHKTPYFINKHEHISKHVEIIWW